MDVIDWVTMPNVTITLTDDQVASVIAQAGTTPPGPTGPTGPSGPTGPADGAIVLPWSPAQSLVYNDFACGDVLVWSLQVPNDNTAYSGPWRINVTQFRGTSFSRQLVMSKVPGSFDDPLMVSNGVSVGFSLWVGSQVQPGDLVYFNLRDWSVDIPGPGCTLGENTNIIVNTQPPPKL